MAYATKDQWAVRHNYANWTAYAAARPNAPTETHVVEMLEDASDIINMEVGSFNSDVSDSRFTSWLEKLCLRMVDRILQIDLGQAMAGSIPMFSPNDFLIEREREKLRSIGKILKHRRQGKWVN